MPRPLNPTLYHALERRFGEVKVYHAGQANRWRTIHRASGLSGKGREQREMLDNGEEYAVNCPFCHDTKHRLYINHMWCVWDEETKTRNMWLVQCLNETSCMSEASRRKQLEQMVFASRGAPREMRVARGTLEPVRKLEEVPLPGVIIPIGRLARRKPHHHAVAYLAGRGFDCGYLEKTYAVGYCKESDRYGLLEDRIFIPVLYKGKMVGWQGRFIGDDVDGVSLKELDIPKYWTMPGFKKNQLPYNYGQAVKHQVAMIVEGPTDVWSAGPRAMACLGVTMSPLAKKRFVRDMRRLHGNRGFVVIMLDPPKPGQKKTHYLKKLALSLSDDFPGRLVMVRLPRGTDPGSTEREAQWRMIRRAAKKQNVKLPREERSIV